MATITDRQGTVVATVDLTTGAFTWERRYLAPQVIRDLVDAHSFPTLVGGPSGEGEEVDNLLDLKRGTPEWAAELAYRIPTLSNDDLIWQEK